MRHCLETQQSERLWSWEMLWLLQVFLIMQQCADLKDPNDLISINYSNDPGLQTALMSWISIPCLLSPEPCRPP